LCFIQACIDTPEDAVSKTAAGWPPFCWKLGSMCIAGDTTSVDWGQQIRAFRRQRLIKQSVLAEMAGVDQATISRWERGLQLPDVQMQRRLRDLLRKATPDEAILKHLTRMSLGEVMLSNHEQTILASSAPYAQTHRVTADHIVGMSWRGKQNGEGEGLIRRAIQCGFFRGDVASVSVVMLSKSLSGHRRNVPTKVLWGALPLSDGTIVRQVQRRTLTDDEFVHCREQNGGPFRIVTMDDLAEASA
jgi:transcriptional regulator with XRE-family HTH domain